MDRKLNRPGHGIKFLSQTLISAINCRSRLDLEDLYWDRVRFQGRALWENPLLRFSLDGDEGLARLVRFYEKPLPFHERFNTGGMAFRSDRKIIRVSIYYTAFAEANLVPEVSYTGQAHYPVERKAHRELRLRYDFLYKGGGLSFGDLPIETDIETSPGLEFYEQITQILIVNTPVMKEKEQK